MSGMFLCGYESDTTEKIKGLGNNYTIYGYYYAYTPKFMVNK